MEVDVGNQTLVSWLCLHSRKNFFSSLPLQSSYNTLNQKIMIKFHFQRFQFVLLQLLWLIVLTFLVCFASNQCPLTISQCNVMSALNTSFNLPTSITNYGNNQTNPCSKQKKQIKNKKITFANKIKQKLQFFFPAKIQKSITPFVLFFFFW